MQEWIENVNDIFILSAMIAEGQRKSIRKMTLEWKDICVITREAALEALGESPKIKMRPWFAGKEKDKEKLDEKVAEARDEDRRARTLPEGGDKEAECKRTRVQLRVAQKQRRKKVTEWEKRGGKR